ncbi:MAG: translesion error-prone DNA polymerase V autoproteolytic subunit [Bacteroidaceae bacterium]|nr:translesion error-prone DNA polymerase V autoproteolytic subunit [Bacteroidaceae bacterium]
MSNLEIYSADTGTSLELPYADGGVRAGFPSPAQDYMSEAIDLNKELIVHKASTFFARAIGDSLEDAMVFEGDILVVDKSLRPKKGDMAVCFLNGEFTLKILEPHKDYMLLIPANSQYSPIKVMPDESFQVWGIVTYIIHKATQRI